MNKLLKSAFHLKGGKVEDLCEGPIGDGGETKDFQFSSVVLVLLTVTDR